MEKFTIEIREGTPSDVSEVFTGRVLARWPLQGEENDMLEIATMLTTALPETLDVGVWEHRGGCMGLVFHHSGGSQGYGPNSYVIGQMIENWRKE
jgi:hypothetical protein